MCGISGVVGLPQDQAVPAVERMCDHMLPRGPDDGGVEWLSATTALGSRRLAIIDLSPAGHQPMRDPERGTTLVFNGMIYNFRELHSRLESEGERFLSACDTEVVLRAYSHYGADCVSHLRGMFAFAIWDERQRVLFLARDRLGIKPLYYVLREGHLLFASQVKALLQSGHVPQRLSTPGLRSYLAYGAVSEPLTAIEGVLALPAAHRATLRDGRLEVERYWEPPAEETSEADRIEALEELRALLDDSVRRHLVSDAPLGIFLSGGLDSSLLAALASRHTKHVRTVSVIFDDPALAETQYMESVARHIGSEHVALPLRPQELLMLLDDAFEAMDQPTFDGINTFVVSRAAAQTGLKVALSGLGADELFDGYGYVGRVRLLERARRLPQPLTLLASRWASSFLGERGRKPSVWLRAGEQGSSYELLRRLFLEPDVRALIGRATRVGMPMPARISAGESLYHQVSELDLTNYMENVLLRDTDAMSMSRGLEVRVPYLDHPLVEWALRQPERTKGRHKALLISAASGLLPAEVLKRAKHGFLLPLPRWIRGELKSEVDEKLRRPPEALAELVDVAAIADIWEEHKASGHRWLQPWALYALARWVDSLAVPSRVAS
jgi:asparagine synthase (glutamine-hydrolysing)